MNNFVEIKNRRIGDGQPKVCVPLVGRTENEILAEVDRIVEISKEANIDMVEFRGDFYNKLNDFSALKYLICEISRRLKDIILLFTIRSEDEGGEKLAFDSPGIKEINKFIIENSLSDMIDIELFSGEDDVLELVALAKEKGVKVIMSNHDFNTTPDENVIIERLTKMQELSADIVKIAVMPQSKLQLLSLLRAVTIMNEEYAKVPVVAISMGNLGAISRLTGEIFGSAITFAALEQGSAPGQIPVKDINKILSSIGRYCV